MVLRILSRGAIAAVAGAAMLAASSAPSPAFTLSAPSLEQPVVGADVESVYWRHWGGWHGGWHHGWGWHRGWGWHGGWHRWGYGGGWHRWGYGWGGPRYYGVGGGYRCWWTPWGFRRCGWV
jgi:hypothetical protein